MKDRIGQQGETLFQLLIGKIDQGAPRFRPHFLGDKWPTIDFYVELEGKTKSTPFFFVQVKATRQGYTQRDDHLRISTISRSSVEALARHPAPTYIAGMDVTRDRGFLLAVTGKTIAPLSSMPTNHEISAASRSDLYEEVSAYWARRSAPMSTSVFTTPNWT